MKKLVWISLSLSIIMCGKPMPDLEPINIVQWKEDKGGCNLKRITFLKDLQNQKEELKGLSEKDIIKLLGRPDHNELYKRNQKFYYYDIAPGRSCPDQKVGEQLVIRFTAMGYAKEISIETNE